MSNDICLQSAVIRGKKVTATLNGRMLGISFNRPLIAAGDAGAEFDAITRDLREIRFALEITLADLIAPQETKEETPRESV